MKLWSGRFEGDINEIADAFNASLPFDKRLYSFDIEGSIAHSKMLGKCGIISKADVADIERGLTEIKCDIENGKLIIENAEDIHSFIENELTRRIGDAGKRMHTARSRNDQVATDVRLYLRDAVDRITALLKQLIGTLADLAEEHVNTIMPAYTHMQKAQPTTLAHHFTAYAQMFLRDLDRLKDCRKRINVLPLGCCACDSTSFPIDREYTAKLLNFDGVTLNSLDGASDRDFSIEFLSAASLIAMHLSRFNEELIYWSGDEFGFVKLPDAFSTGSSIMPQKKNPDMCELIRGKTGRVYGDLMSMLTVMKGLPLAYNKDMQEDKEPLFDADDTLTASLRVFTAMIKALEFNKNRLNTAGSESFTAATDCADYLAKKGVPFREAHEILGRLVIHCIKEGVTLQDLSSADFAQFSPVFKSDIVDVVKAENIVKSRKVVGGCAPETELEQISSIRRAIESV